MKRKTSSGCQTVKDRWKREGRMSWLHNPLSSSSLHVFSRGLGQNTNLDPCSRSKPLLPELHSAEQRNVLAVDRMTDHLEYTIQPAGTAAAPTSRTHLGGPYVSGTGQCNPAITNSQAYAC